VEEYDEDEEEEEEEKSFRSADNRLIFCRDFRDVHEGTTYSI
jgi:hypothetical protein